MTYLKKITQYLFFVDPCCNPGIEYHHKAIKAIPREGHAKGGASMWPAYKEDCRKRKGEYLSEQML